jgi:hypothetical protein
MAGLRVSVHKWYKEFGVWHGARATVERKLKG